MNWPENVLFESDNLYCRTGMFLGFFIAGPVCFGVLLFATGNVLLASYAIIAIASVVVSVLGFSQKAMGWDLGVGEAIAGVIVIGFSVDYARVRPSPAPRSRAAGCPPPLAARLIRTRCDHQGKWSGWGGAGFVGYAHAPPPILL